MRKIISTLALAVSLAAPALASAQAYGVVPYDPAAWTGTHPYDLRDRRHRNQINAYPYVSDNDYYYSPFRSSTYALHPFNRDRYYDRVNYVRDPATRRVYPVYERVPNSISATCRNYAYERPNYRVPPFEYRCQR